jgi:hypothetical protein
MATERICSICYQGLLEFRLIKRVSIYFILRFKDPVLFNDDVTVFSISASYTLGFLLTTIRDT